MSEMDYDALAAQINAKHNAETVKAAAPKETTPAADNRPLSLPDITSATGRALGGALARHPSIATALGGLGGAVAGIPAGPGGMIGGGALGAAGANSWAQVAQHAMNDPNAPKTSLDAAKQAAIAGGEGALTGAGVAGGLPAAPAALRMLATKPAAGAIAGLSTLARGASPGRALEVGVGTALIPGIGNRVARLVGKAANPLADAIESYALKARMASTLEKEAPEAVETAEAVLKSGRTTTTGTVPAPVGGPTMGQITAKMPVGTAVQEAMAPSPTAGPKGAPTGLEGLPVGADGMVTVRTASGGSFKVNPARVAELQAAASGGPTKPSMALADSITNKVMGMKEQGLTNPQIADALRATHGIPRDAAEQMVEMIDKAKLPQATIMNRTLVPEGQRSLPTVGGGQAQMRFTGAHQGPFPRIYDPNQPTNPVDPSDMLRKSIEAYRGAGQ